MLSNPIMQVRQHHQTLIFTPPQRATISLKKDLQKPDSTLPEATNTYMTTAKHQTVSQSVQVRSSTDNNMQNCKENNIRPSKSNSKLRKTICIEPLAFKSQQIRKTIKPLCTSLIGNENTINSKATKLANDSQACSKRKPSVTLDTGKECKRVKVDKVTKVHDKIPDGLVKSNLKCSSGSPSTLSEARSSSSNGNKRTGKKGPSLRERLIKKQFKLQTHIISKSSRKHSPTKMARIMENLAKLVKRKTEPQNILSNLEAVTNSIANCNEVTILPHVPRPHPLRSPVQHTRPSHQATVSKAISSNMLQGSENQRPRYRIRKIGAKTYSKFVNELRSPENSTTYIPIFSSLPGKPEHQSTALTSTQSSDSIQLPDWRFNAESKKIYGSPKFVREDYVNFTETEPEKGELSISNRTIDAMYIQLTKDLHTEIAAMANEGAIEAMKLSFS